ncbi:MAG: hypothetical protein IKZ53_01390 [Selenomonadaceae bacterium]|nr:hypothetical protein [Selenomonadaceae bacterium]
MKQILMTVLALIFLTSTASAQSKKILYVPMDDRPCNLYQVAQVAEKTRLRTLNAARRYDWN